MCFVKNNSGSDVAQFGVLGIDGVLFTLSDNPDEFKNRIVLKGITPVIATHTGKFVVLAEPIKNGALGRCFIHGVFPANVEITSTSDTKVDVKASSTEMKTGTSGLADIIYMPASTGTGKMALIRIGGAGGGATYVQQWVTITSALTKPGHYMGTLLDPVSGGIDITDGSNSGPGDYFTASATQVIVFNMDEEGSNSHDLLELPVNRTAFPCWKSSKRDDDDTYDIYLIDARGYEAPCTPFA